MITSNKHLSFIRLLLPVVALTTLVEASVTTVADSNPPTNVKKNNGASIPVTIDVLANDFITPNGVITINLLGSGTKGTFSVVGAPGSQTVQYAPDLNELGLDTIQYTATDLDGTSTAVGVIVQIFPDYSIALSGAPVTTFTSNTDASLQFSFTVGDDNDCTAGIGTSLCTFTPTLYSYDGAGGNCDPSSPLTVDKTTHGIDLVTPVTWDSTQIVVQLDLIFATLDGAGDTAWWTDGTPDKLHFCLGVNNVVSGVTINTELVKYDTDVDISGSFDSSTDSVAVELFEKSILSDTENTEFVAHIGVSDCGLGTEYVAGSPMTLCVYTGTAGFSVSDIDSASISGESTQSTQTLINEGGTYDQNLVYEDCADGVCEITFMVDLQSTVPNGVVPDGGTSLTFDGAALLGNGRRLMLHAEDKVKGNFGYNFHIDPPPVNHDDESSGVGVFVGRNAAIFIACVMALAV